jgi:hypothetical protein
MIPSIQKHLPMLTSAVFGVMCAFCFNFSALAVDLAPIRTCTANGQSICCNFKANKCEVGQQECATDADGVPICCGCPDSWTEDNPIKNEVCCREAQEKDPGLTWDGSACVFATVQECRTWNQILADDPSLITSGPGNNLNVDKIKSIICSCCDDPNRSKSSEVLAECDNWCSDETTIPGETTVFSSDSGDSGSSETPVPGLDCSEQYNPGYYASKFCACCAQNSSYDSYNCPSCSNPPNSWSDDGEAEGSDSGSDGNNANPSDDEIAARCGYAANGLDAFCGCCSSNSDIKFEGDCNFYCYGNYYTTAS